LKEVEVAIFSPDSTIIASGSYNGTARLWDVATGTQLQMFEGEGIGDIILFHPDNVLLLTSYSNAVRVWNLQTGDLQSVLEYLINQYGRTEAISLDCQLLVSRPIITTVTVRNVNAGVIEHILQGHSDWAGCVLFLPDGTMITSGDGKVVMLWEIDTGLLRAKLGGYKGKISTIDISKIGLLVVSLSRDRTDKLWDATTGTLKQSLSGSFKGDVYPLLQVVYFILDRKMDQFGFGLYQLLLNLKE
jgi:WD40 repeat protein